jgi:hypothetical protein
LGVYLHALSAYRDLNSGHQGSEVSFLFMLLRGAGLGTIVAPRLSVACQTLWHLLTRKHRM